MHATKETCVIALGSLIVAAVAMRWWTREPRKVEVRSRSIIVAGLVAVIGISMFAFPTAVLGAGFLEEVGNEHKTCPHCGKET